MVKIRVLFQPKRHQPECITIDKLYRMYRAWKFQRSPAKLDRVHGVVGFDGRVFAMNIFTFSDWVDLYTKNARIYRVY